MKKIITSSTFLFIGIIFLAGCTGQQNQNATLKKVQEQEKEIPNEAVEKVSAEETIDFEHPGNDAVGKKVEGMDSLINSTSTNGYDEDPSGEVLSELQ